MHLLLFIFGLLFNFTVSAIEECKPTSYKSAKDIAKEVLKPGYKPPKEPWWK